MNNLFAMARQQDIDIEYVRLPNNESATINTSEKCYIFADYSLMWATARERVHIAHELGHCATGSFYNFRSTFDLRGKHERRADNWAIKKLVPKDELIEAVQSGNTECWQLAEHFDVTCEFMKKVIEFYK